MKYIIKDSNLNLFWEKDLSFSSDKNDAKVFSKQIDANEKCWNLRDIGLKVMVIKK